MEYTQLGTTGLRVSRLCLGTMSYGSKSWRPWVLTEEEGRPFIQRALELGINFFDTADMYSRGVSEEILGRAVRDFAKRDQVIIGTKVFHPMSDDPADRGLSRRHIMEGIEQSLKRLGMEYVDLYQIHRFDPRVPVEETMEALHDLVRSGKVRYLGASSMYAYQFASMQHVAATHGWTPFVSMQNHYNLIYREEEREMIPFCRRDNVAILPWSPLARGFLTGSRKRGSQDATLRERTDDYAKDLYYQESDYQIVDRLLALALGKEVKPAQIALAWLLRKEGVTAPIIGATQMVQLEEAVQALQVSLSEAEAKFLEELYVPHRVLGHT